LLLYVSMKHPGHTYGGFIPAILERGMTSRDAMELHRDMVAQVLRSGRKLAAPPLENESKNCSQLRMIMQDSNEIIVVGEGD
jgi:hypothetical protein